LMTNTPSLKEQISVRAKVQKSGVARAMDPQALTFSPNPSSNGLLLVISATSGVYRFSVRDALGREIASAEAHLSADVPQTLDLNTTLSAGLYLVHVSDQKTSWVEKVIVR
jgi:hypothetical protein